MLKKPGKADRILWLLKFFNKEHSGTVSDIINYLNGEGLSAEKKSIQRDLALMFEHNLVDFRDFSHKERIWEYMGITGNTPKTVRIQQNEMLSYYMLKAYIKHFKKTVIAEGIEELDKKLDKLFPGEVFRMDSMLWNKNIGYYDYTQEDLVIRPLIRHIAEKQWVEIEYLSSDGKKKSRFKCLPRTMFENKGNLYAVVFTCGKVDEHRVLLIQNINQISPCKKVSDKILPFDFNEWSKERFGVYHGKPANVKLLIKKEFTQYFEKRFWHNSQKISKDKNGNMILEMTVPLVKDFESWIMSWTGVIKVLEPLELTDRIKKNLKEGMKEYNIPTPEPRD